MLKKIEDLLRERFENDCVISLATSEDNVPSVREVDAFYDHGCFYFITCPDS